MPTAPRPPSARKTAKASPPSPKATAAPLDHAALLEALQQLTQPLAALSVARGLTYATVEEILKRSFVAAARDAQPETAGHRLVSRISTVTGLNRREVTRLTQQDAEAEAPRHSPATQLFTRWIADPKLKTRKGEIRSLPRQGPAPSFEALARSVTMDVHPRSLLDELCRLGLAREEDDMVHPVQSSIVPKDDSARMLGFLGNNVGDHLRAAVANVVSRQAPHPEQAVFADGLTHASVDEIAALVRKHWQGLLTTTVPELHRMIDRDAADDPARHERVRIGLYMYSEPVPEPAPDEPSTRASAKPKRR